eukprot:GDKJ01020290.1.p2 GENE.GDKJ01020290.1~~GDKJ01020290.1.p2  ORF type:complete len:259 (+),score=15.16 GDKJ01020290.1:2469-3245(+)
MKGCPICANQIKRVFNHEILKQYSVDYFFCEKCGLLQTEEPFWLNEAYSSAIATADTGLVQRNISIAAKLSVILFCEFSSHANYLDVAGGYGMLVRMMRDIGFHFYWDDKFCQNLLAKGFEKNQNRNEIAAITAFEVLEHVHDPLAFIKGMLEENGTTTLIFTTELFEGAPPSTDWWYYAFETGQHISFYQPKTLQYIAEKLNLKFYSANGMHIFTRKNINHLKLKFITGKFNFILKTIIRRQLQSLTLSDHQHLLQS